MIGALKGLITMIIRVERIALKLVNCHFRDIVSNFTYYPSHFLSKVQDFVQCVSFLRWRRNLQRHESNARFLPNAY